MTTRQLKVEEHDRDGRGYSKTRLPLPKIRLKGKWLQAAGFPPGMSVTVTVCSPGVIELRLNGIRPRDGEYLIAAERLDVALANHK